MPAGPAWLPLDDARYGSAPLRWLRPTQGIFTHFEGVGLWDDVSRAEGIPPYPPDAAALHHIFPGGWIWVLRFNNGITSAGAALHANVHWHHDVRENLLRAPQWRTAFSQDMPSTCAVPIGPSDAAVRARSTCRVPLPRGGRREMGAASVGRGRDRPIAVDGIPADAARPRATARGRSWRPRPPARNGKPRSPSTRVRPRRSWTSPSSSSVRSTRAWPTRRSSSA